MSRAKVGLDTWVIAAWIQSCEDGSDDTDQGSQRQQASAPPEPHRETQSCEDVTCETRQITSTRGVSELGGSEDVSDETKLTPRKRHLRNQLCGDVTHETGQSTSNQGIM